VRERAVPVVPMVRAVRAARAGAVRSALVTTSMGQRGGWGAPENNREVSVAAAPIMRHCFNDPGYRGPLPTRYRAIPRVTAHDNAISYEGARNAGKMSRRRRM
jgi:hypothetical protein